MSKRVTRTKSRQWARIICKGFFKDMEVKHRAVQTGVEEIVRRRLHPSVTHACRLYPSQIGIRKSVTIACVSDIIGEEEHFENKEYVFREGARQIWVQLSFPIPQFCRVIVVCKGEFERLWAKKVRWIDDALAYQEMCFDEADKIYHLGTLKRLREAYPGYENLFEL